MASYQIGDCFLFKDVIIDFGLVLLDIQNLPEGQWYHLFPVKLNKARIGTDQFRYGDVYLTHLGVSNDPEGARDGFMGFFFQQERNFESIDRLLNYEGSVKIKQQYAHPVGVTAATEYWQFEVVFEQWNDIFGFDTNTTKTRKIKLTEVLE